MSAPATEAPSAPSRTQRGLAAGAVTGASMLGLLIGIGHRAGTAWRPINAAAHSLLGSRADGVWSYHGSVTLVGGLVVLTMSVAAGLVVARITSSFHTVHLIAAAAGVAFAGYVLHLHVVARVSGGLAALLSVGELRGMYVMVAVALVVGMRFAFSRVATPTT